MADKKDVFTVSCQEINKNKMIDCAFVVEDLFEDDDKQQFNCGEKTLNAKKFPELAESKDLVLKEKSIDNLNNLLIQLGIKAS